MNSEWRNRFLELVAQGRGPEARQAADDYLTHSTEGGRWRIVAQCVRALPEGALGLKTVRVALLASFSLEFIQDALLASGLVHGLRIHLHLSGFAQYAQEILEPTGPLYAFQPDVVILALEEDRLLPSWQTQQMTPDPDLPESWVAQAMAVIDPLITTFRSHSEALLLIHDLVPPVHPALGILDGRSTPGSIEGVQAVNAALRARARSRHGVYIVNYSGVVARTGMEHWLDRRMALLAKAPIAMGQLPRLAGEYLKYLRAVAGLTKKCLVTDLDNTLWGGVLGEDGLHGLKLGPDYPGSAHLAYQQLLLQLHARGVLLAIASKNNPQDVEELFRDHPGMLVKPHHFVRQEIHWQPKSHSLHAIADSLNIGLEHLVFVDDNPAECAEIRAAWPMVTVIQFPKRPEEVVDALLGPGWFDGLGWSVEDRNRATLYAQRDRAEALKTASSSLPDYYASLQMRVDILAVTEGSLTRTAQLTQKTNQFNLTTIRHGEQEVARRMRDAEWLILTVRVVDCFGDNGIVGVMMARQRTTESVLEIETFLLSCRVIGRTIETAMLAELCHQARQRSLRYLLGRVMPTPKNLPARALYAEHGFSQLSKLLYTPLPDERQWMLDLEQGGITRPTWMVPMGDDHGRTD
ncbi:MAG: HAD-IIIC family phosphatase [Magnetococcales bacterium]|nr:HAD family hydrolase [Magnetococcales bacterium]NGZ06269.1 HAD-IIIC family phosphatase [Magnetococcales bacterium]